MGEQPNPIGTSTPWASTPRSDRIVEPARVLELVVLSQHCSEPVEHCANAAVAAARMEKIASLENMMRRVVVELGW